MGTCFECRFWIRHTGACRRYPPTVTAHAYPDGEHVFASTWPETDQDHWCGEYQSRTPPPPPVTPHVCA